MTLVQDTLTRVTRLYIESCLPVAITVQMTNENQLLSCNSGQYSAQRSSHVQRGASEGLDSLSSVQ